MGKFEFTGLSPFSLDMYKNYAGIHNETNSPSHTKEVAARILAEIDARIATREAWTEHYARNRQQALNATEAQKPPTVRRKRIKKSSV